MTENQKRIKITTEYSDDGTTFLLAAEGNMKLEASDILAALRQVTGKVEELARSQAMIQAEIEAKKKGSLLGPDGSPVSSNDGKPRLVKP